MCCSVSHSFHKDLPLHHCVKYEMGFVLIKKLLLLRWWLGLEMFSIVLGVLGQG